MRVIVVGAGLSGLAAGRALLDAGHEVALFDKGRSPGGRMATRRIGAATLDHGAQFFTIRSDTFAEVIAPHLGSGLVYEWCRGFAGDDGYPRYAVRGGMNALAKALAAPLDVRTSSLVFAIHRAAPGASGMWQVTLDDGTVHTADALVVTCPVPQTYSLLVTAGVELPAELIRGDYDRTIALLATLDRSSALQAPGGLQHPTEQLSFVTDNVRKGISEVPALTVHAGASWSEAHWSDDHDTLSTALTEAAAPYIGDAVVTAAQVKKWRFATPRTIWPERCWQPPDDSAPVVLAGDAFGGPKVEGAVLSGLAAAAALLG
jgi:predicted NAD/FAD-dependent oxidoreductase